MYGLVGKMTATSGGRDELAAILVGVGSMPGRLCYVVAHDRHDPDGLWVTEVWESAEAHRASLELPAVQEAIARGRPLIAGFEYRFETSPVEGTLSAARGDSTQWSGPVSVEDMYGEWDYEAAKATLERSLDPRPGTSIFDTVGALGIGPSDVVLDIGGRDARHALVMAERFGCRAVCIDPVPDNIADGRRNVAEHELGHLVEVRRGSIENIPADDDMFDLVFSRDMLGHIADLDGALRECGRVLRTGGAIVVHEVFATSMLEPEERRMVCTYTATVPERLSVETFERTVRDAGFSIQEVDVIGSEWTEANQEKGTVPNYLLQVARLRRGKVQLIEELGEVPYRVMYGNALWSIYQLIGKLESRVYTLARAGE